MTPAITATVVVAGTGRGIAPLHATSHAVTATGATAVLATGAARIPAGGVAVEDNF